MNIKTILVDDHAVMREGLCSILKQEPEIDIIGEASDGRTAVDMVDKLLPDLVIMDIGMSDLNGIEATRQIKARHSEVKVIALSTYSDKRYVIEMIEAGASGYVLKSNAGDDLLRAIRAVSRNHNYLCPDVATAVVGSYVDRLFPTEKSAASILGPREREVLQLLAEGKTSKQIAESLHVSVKTVETHRSSIMNKLNIHSIAELTKYAVREGLTPLEC